MESGRYNGLMRISTKYYQRTKRGGPVQACEVTSEGLLAEGKTLKLNLQNKGGYPRPEGWSTCQKQGKPMVKGQEEVMGKNRSDHR